MTVAQHIKRALAIFKTHPIGAMLHLRKAAEMLKRKPKPVPPKPVPPKPPKPPVPPTPHPLDIFGVDYSSNKIPYDALHKAGVRFALRYISHDAGKDLTAAELRALHARGVKVGLVFETTAQRALSGFTGGQGDAKYAKARCDALGLKDIPVFFACDWDATDAQKPDIAKYLGGAVSVLGHSRVGVYGSYYVVKYMVNMETCAWFWQTYAWSGGLVHPQAHVLQYSNGHSIGGLSLDFDHARNLEWAR